ncbi:uncharacterized protein MONBRDRAFT_34421 [Monosiga brevicollis MX1]|uniref:Uncharacterized protein n=1 Tax=Monosiga brevicollis TaxID=81824 RepID=A9VBN1_MONBE|nr:uncharacterized protein MONBRDRAFT_34421 [Monosiga brevicollis MX1]EDQ85127.1 predicted protein [Monosiga brevicollis MX1]|eukprot:XP_001750131.1 hypothetical protein [Monosiga brevicollis MX1]
MASNGESATKKVKVTTADGSNVAVPADLEKQIIRQVEYYFSDRNLPRDSFMQQKLKESKEGWIPLTVLLTFNRLKQLSEDPEVIAAAMQTVDDPLVEVSDDGTALRRAPTKPLEDQKDLNERSIYAKGFDVEKLTIDYVQTWISSMGCFAESVSLRRKLGSRELKGSVFVQLSSRDQAEKIVAEPREFDGNKIFVETKPAYHERKRDERRDKRMAKKQKEDEKKMQLKYEAVEATMTKDAVVKLEDLHEDCSREDLKDVFEKFGDVAWVDYTRGEPTAHIRFKEEGKASSAVQALTESNATIKDKPVKAEALKDQEEKEYWVKMEEDRQAMRSRRGGGRGGRGGRGRGRGRGGRGAKRNK